MLVDKKFTDKQAYAISKLPEDLRVKILERVNTFSRIKYLAQILNTVGREKECEDISQEELAEVLSLIYCDHL